MNKRLENRLAIVMGLCTRRSGRDGIPYLVANGLTDETLLSEILALPDHERAHLSSLTDWVEDYDAGQKQNDKPNGK